MQIQSQGTLTIKKKAWFKMGRRKKADTNESTISKKDFRESPSVEKFYKTIYAYQLREEAYKAAIEIYLNLKK